MNPISVTFDSNVWECIADTEKLTSHDEATALRKIRAAIEARRVDPYLSDVVITLEAIRKSERSRFFAGIATQARRTDRAVEVLEDGTTHITNKITIRTNFEHHPGLHDKLYSPLRSALDLGFKFINVPRIAWMRLDDHLYKPLEVDEETLSQRCEKTFDAAETFQRKGCGFAWITELAKQVIQQHPELAGLGDIRACAHSDDQARLPAAVAEWADGDALAAHYGHAHDVFCTLDQGKNAGRRSILHQSHRKFLNNKFSIRILTPAELATLL